MQTDKNDMTVEQSVSMHSYLLEWPCKRQIVADPKLHNASHICTNWRKGIWNVSKLFATKNYLSKILIGSCFGWIS